VKKVVGLAARSAGDDEAVKRVTDVETTADRLTSNQPTTGGPTAVELFGNAVIDKLSEWLKLGSGPEGTIEGGGSQVDQLEDLAIREAHLFHSPDEKTFASFPVNDHQETWPTTSKRFRRWLSRRFAEKTGKGPGRKALDDTVLRLEERALAEGEQLAVHVRVSAHDGSIFIDLGGDDWRVVEVTGHGWRIRKDPPVKFRRSNGMLPLPTPVRGGRIAELRPFLNYGTPEDWTLIVAFLLAAFRPQGPQPGAGPLRRTGGVRNPRRPACSVGS